MFTLYQFLLSSVYIVWLKAVWQVLIRRALAPRLSPGHGLGGCLRTLFRIKNPDGFSWMLVPISAHLFDIFHVFGIPFSSIEFAWIFHRFFKDFWYPWSCKKTILTLYSSLKTRNRRFQNFTDLSSMFDLVLTSFLKHFLINFHTFSTLNFALISYHGFDGKLLPEWSGR